MKTSRFRVPRVRAKRRNGPTGAARRLGGQVVDGRREWREEQVGRAPSSTSSDPCFVMHGAACHCHTLTTISCICLIKPTRRVHSRVTPLVSEVLLCTTPNACMSDSISLIPVVIPTAWNPKQLETNGCSNMAIEILYIGNGCLGKHPFLSGWDWGSR